jgi:glycosyltransferase involved in cell wall biosynthesis
MPQVSVITPYRNAARFLPELVGTLQGQTYRDWECLLVDDGSWDGGPELLEPLTKGDLRFRRLALPATAGCESPRRLPGIPRNLGLEEARAPLVAFLDVDDLWHPRKLEQQLAFHRERGLDLSVTAYGRFQRAEAPLRALRRPPARLLLAELRRRNPMPLLTVVVKRELLGRGFEAVPHEDYLLWLNLLRDRPMLRYGCLPSVLAFYRQHGDNTSRRQLGLLRWTCGVYRRHGLPPLRALLQTGLWGADHGLRLARQWVLPQALLPSVLTLQAAAPWRLGDADRWP